VNQNFPPNPPGQSGDYPSGDPQGQGYDPNAQGSNPYYSAQQSQPPPDLDASAPQLKSVESQRINRKMLLMLGGIVALLILMTLVVLKNATSKKEDDVKKPREEKVVIPDLPKGAGSPTGPDFADVQPQPQPVPVQELPPLPPEDPVRATADRAMRERDGRDAGPAQPMGPQGPTLAERRMGITDGGGRPGAPGSSTDNTLQSYLNNIERLNPQQQAAAGNAGQARDAGNKISIAQYQRNPDTLLVRGTYIRWPSWKPGSSPTSTASPPASSPSRCTRSTATSCCCRRAPRRSAATRANRRARASPCCGIASPRRTASTSPSKAPVSTTSAARAIRATTTRTGSAR
jgi:hypothetical protein